MSRARRLEPIRDIAQEAERAAAIRVATLQRQLAEAQQREADLRRYRCEYQDGCLMRTGKGLQVRQLREYQTFLARLGAALDAQKATVEQLRRDAERERSQLAIAISRRKAMGKIIERAQREEQSMNDKRTQREQDEHAIRRIRVTP